MTPDPFGIGEVWEEGRDEATYRGDSHNSVSNSERECFRKCPEEYKAVYLDKTLPPETTTALAIGSGLHHRVLLPNTECPYVTIPPSLLKSNGARNTQSKDWQGFEAENTGKYLLKPSEVAQVESMIDRLREHPVAGRLLYEEGGWPELPLKAIDPETELWLRIRMDWLVGCEDTRILADIKTYGGDVGNLKKLSGHILDYGYCRQLAFYRHVHRLRMGCDCRCCLIFLEKKPPNRVRVVELSEDWLSVADMENQHTLAAMKSAFETGTFLTPGIDDVIVLDRPRWADNNEYELGAE